MKNFKSRIYFFLDTKRWMFFDWLWGNHPVIFEWLNKRFPNFTRPF